MRGDERGKARQPAHEDPRVAAAQDQRPARRIPPGDPPVDPRIGEKRAVDAVVVHRRLPFVARKIAPPEQPVHLRWVGRQPRIDEDPVARVAAHRFEQQVRADLEVVVHPLAEAIVVREGDRSERQLARVEADPESLTERRPGRQTRRDREADQQRRRRHRRQRRAQELRDAWPPGRRQAVRGHGRGDRQDRRRHQREVGAETDRMGRQNPERQDRREQGRVSAVARGRRRSRRGTWPQRRMRPRRRPAPRRRARSAPETRRPGEAPGAPGGGAGIE